MIGLLAYLALITVIPALALGHHGQDFPPIRWWRAHRARTARPAPEQPTAIRARRSVPSWACAEILIDKLTDQELDSFLTAVAQYDGT